MTDAELNAEIATMRGWRRSAAVGEWLATSATPESDVEWGRSRDARADRFDEDPRWEIAPPFASEWALAGNLLEELNDPSLMRDNAWGPPMRGPWCCETDEGHVYAPTPTLAIALAWLAWKRGEAKA